MVASVQIVPTTQTKRKMRTPRHNWYLKFRPFQIQPFMMAPVLPGETLKNVTIQARVVTDPILNPLMGWWCEHYLFYVKLRDLYSRDMLTNMLLKPETDLTSLDNVTDVKYFHQNGAETPAINWALRCTEVIVDNYFRREGETAASFTLDGMYTANRGIDGISDSALRDDQTYNATGVDQDLTSTTPGQGDGTAAVKVSEISEALKEYGYAIAMKTTDMTFEDWCATFGVRMPKEELFKPELLRYGRDWAYPSNTIDPTNGTPRSAVSWSTQLRADKDRYFKEPGFIVGIAVVRPKTYYQNQRSAGVVMMNNAYMWLPPALASDPEASFHRYGTADGPFNQTSTFGYSVDVKDLFIHGDQFVNFDLGTETGINKVVLPSTSLLNRHYPSSTDVDNLFVNTAPGVGVVRQDGVCELHILGRQTDTSPTNWGTNKTV